MTVPESGETETETDAETPWIREASYPPADEFAAWFKARLDEDRNCAAAAGHGDRLVSYVGQQPNAGWVGLDLTDNCRPSYDVRFARRHGPRRVLGEVAVKRELLALHEERHGSCHACGGYWPCLTLKLAAWPWTSDSMTYPDPR